MGDGDKEAYQLAERKSGTSAEALKREVKYCLFSALKDLALEKNDTDRGDNRDEPNNIAVSFYSPDLSLLSLCCDSYQHHHRLLRMRGLIVVSCTLARMFFCDRRYGGLTSDKFDPHHLFGLCLSATDRPIFGFFGREF